jgi:RNA methyltransferase, TrmH family
VSAHPQPPVPTAQHISSRDNAFLKDLRRLAHDNTAYRKQGRVWAEGDHLYRAAMARGFKPAIGVFSESFWQNPESRQNPKSRAQALVECAQAAAKNIVVSDAAFKDLSGLESPANMGFVFDLPAAVAVQARVDTVILDRVQDAGNVGSILRSASAFGFRQIIALKGTAALWSPKVLRAGMGAHWGLKLLEGMELSALDTLQVPIVVTSSHQGEFIQNLKVPHPCAWALGHEGQGVCAELMASASHFARIGQPWGEESLNVAAAAAICLHASSLPNRDRT